MPAARRNASTPFSRPYGVPALAAVLLTTALLVVPPVAGHRPAQRFAAPFTGFGLYGGSSYGASSGRATNQSIPYSNPWSPATGKWMIELRASAVPSSCTTGGSGSAYESNGLYMISPNLTVASGGLYVLRTNWWFEWYFTYTTTTAANPSSQACQSEATILAYMWVNDLTTNTTTSQAVVYYSDTMIVDVNSSAHVRENAWISLPYVAALTHRQVYQLAFSISFDLVAISGARANSAVSSLDIGTAGRGMTLQAVTVK